MKRIGLVFAAFGVVTLYAEHEHMPVVARVFGVANAQAAPVVAEAPPDFGKVALFSGGVFITLLVLELFARTIAARKIRKENEKEFRRLLKDLPQRFKDARAALGHSHVTESTKRMLDLAKWEFNAVNAEAKNPPDVARSLSLLRHINSVIDVVLENAQHEKKFALASFIGTPGYVDEG